MNNDLMQQAKQMRDEMIAQATRRADEWLQMTLAALGQIPTVTGVLPAEARHPVRIELDSANSLIDNIREVIRSFGQRVFTTLDVGNAISSVYDVDNPTRRSTLSATLKKLATVQGELHIVRKGRGSLPTKYRAANPSSSSTGESS